MPYSIDQITQIIGARRVGKVPGQVEWLLTDSRSLSIPETTLFFAIRTTRGSGADYIGELARRGVRHFVVGNDDFHDIVNRISLSDTSQFPFTINLLIVGNALTALQRLSAYHRHTFAGPVVGITGSNGKTIVKEWLHQLLSPDHRVVRSPRSYNSQVGVPLSVWQMSNEAQVALIEAGISQPGEMSRLQPIVRPDIGVLTNIGEAHQENFRTKAEKCAEKFALFSECHTVVCHVDDAVVSDALRMAHLPGRVFGISRSDAGQDLYVCSVDKQADHTSIVYRYQGVECSYLIPYIDTASVENSLTCLAVCLCLGMSPHEVDRRMPQLQPIAMRLEVKEGRNGCSIINDAYSSDLASIDIALDFLHRRTAGNTPHHRTLILSDIEQTGLTPAILYARVAHVVQGRGVDRLIGIGHEITAHAGLFDLKAKTFYPDTASALHAIDTRRLDFHHETILIKGARSFHLESLADRLCRKVHQTTLEVNLSAMVANLNHFRSFLRPDTKMVCMVKASAYGAGANQVAKTLQDHRVDYLAVAVADEGVELRQAGITANILIMNPEPSAFKTMFDHRLEPEVYSFRLLDALGQAARREGVTRHPIHIKIDTGMHRLGFEPTDMPALIGRLSHQDALLPRSVFSHMVGSDTPGLEDFTRRQVETFTQAADQLQAALPHRLLRHICNSAGILRFPQWQFDMVRLGIGLYGINPYDNTLIHNVSTLRTTILQIREVKAGDTVGYGRRGEIERPSRIAAIPIGYADGMDRHLGNGRCYCMVNGQPAPYVGNICMDVCMIDVTDIPCQEGDSVEIFGDHLPVTILSEALGTIPYEVLTSVSERVKRVYFQD